MKTNVGSIDKIIRIVAGIVLIALGIMGIGAPWTFIGIVPLATGLLGWCPAYTLIGANTCSTKK
ncbi:YgaP family membrane protein [Rhodocyclaceae bacterium SMB388]